MTEKKRSHQIIGLIYGILLSVLIVALGVCLILSCIKIYQSGDAPFTRASIAAQFSKISVLAYVCIGAVLLGIPLLLVFPVPEAKLRGTVDERKMLERMRSRINLYDAALSVKQKKSLLWERRLRVWLRIFGAAVCVAAAIPLVLYLIDLSHFTPELNDSILAATYMALPLVVLGGGACLLEVYLERASIRREIAAIKVLIATGEVRGWDWKGGKPTGNESHVAVNVVRVILFAVAVGLIFMGISNGGMRDVLGKAIKICTECIGLG